MQIEVFGEPGSGILASLNGGVVLTEVVGELPNCERRREKSSKQHSPSSDVMNRQRERGVPFKIWLFGF